MRIMLISEDASYGNGAAVATALKKYANVTTVFSFRDTKGMYKQTDNILWGYHNIKDGFDKYIVISARAILDAWKYLKNRDFTAILTDTHYVLNRKKINLLLGNRPVFAMPDLFKHRGNLPTNVFYQPFDLSWVKIEKNKDVTVCHSPYNKPKFEQKGTRIINKIISEIDVNYNLITDKLWVDSIKIKSKAHIFVDQILDSRLNFDSGIGKSGLEAMLLDCLVISNGTMINTDIPYPPIIFADKDILKVVLEYYICNEKDRKDVVRKQREWALKYLNYDFVAKRLL